DDAATKPFRRIRSRCACRRDSARGTRLSARECPAVQLFGDRLCELPGVVRPPHRGGGLARRGGTTPRGPGGRRDRRTRSRTTRNPPLPCDAPLALPSRSCIAVL